MWAALKANEPKLASEIAAMSYKKRSVSYDSYMASSYAYVLSGQQSKAIGLLGVLFGKKDAKRLASNIAQMKKDMKRLDKIGYQVNLAALTQISKRKIPIKPKAREQRSKERHKQVQTGGTSAATTSKSEVKDYVQRLKAKSEAKSAATSTSNSIKTNAKTTTDE